MKIIITLTEQQAGNLIVFLNRTTMNGQEAASFQELVAAINAAQKVGVEQPKNLANNPETN